MLLLALQKYYKNTIKIYKFIFMRVKDPCAFQKVLFFVIPLKYLSGILKKI
jgi:hypothetical protein